MPHSNTPPPDAAAIRAALQELLTLIADAVVQRLIAKNELRTPSGDEQASSTSAS